MSTQFFLEESDIETLINLLLRSQQSRTREALCFSIGIDPKRLSFIRDCSDSDFFLLLIRYLNEIGEQEALCKLCCKELFLVFPHGKYATILSEIAAKLNCNQKSSQNSPNNKQPSVLPSIPASRSGVNPFHQLAKNKLIMGSAIFIIGLTGFSLYHQNSNSSNNPHPTKPSVSQTPNPIPTDFSEESVNKINSIYQEVLGREATISEIRANVKFLENGVQLNSIRAWIAKTSSLLREGNVISLECQGHDHTGFKWLDVRIKDGTVSLAPDTDAQTKWKVHVIGDVRDGVVALENQGKTDGPRWLDGVTYNNSVNLAPNTEGHYTGTKWRINIIGDGVVALDNQGKSKWLNGVTKNGSVNLAPNTEGGNTGTKWRIIKQ
ncbi:MAG: hypothetical protein HC862_14480 [Scytonema sp. RU_4_4]|nr:hypothetical protein [Scytonema sp. RU_4_4]NJR72561.1 hypothetical protein [Scytonema sp. CRU_2_7]